MTNRTKMPAKFPELFSKLLEYREGFHEGAHLLDQMLELHGGQKMTVERTHAMLEVLFAMPLFLIKIVPAHVLWQALLSTVSDIEVTEEESES